MSDDNPATDQSPDPSEAPTQPITTPTKEMPEPEPVVIEEQKPESWIEKHREKMPISETYLASVTESIIEFQLRKVRWSVGILEFHGEELKKWKIERVAGLRTGYPEQVKEVILSFLPSGS